MYLQNQKWRKVKEKVKHQRNNKPRKRNNKKRVNQNLVEKLGKDSMVTHTQLKNISKKHTE